MQNAFLEKTCKLYIFIIEKIKKGGSKNERDN